MAHLPTFEVQANSFRDMLADTQTDTDKLFKTLLSLCEGAG